MNQGKSPPGGKIRPVAPENSTGSVPSAGVRKRMVELGGCACLLVGLFITSRYNFLLFHTFAELFSIAVAWGVFMLVWNARSFISNDALPFLGTAYLFVGFIDLLHALAYKGMGIFPDHMDSGYATQLWIAARGMEAVSLALFPLLLGRRVPQRAVMAAFAGGATLLVLSIFYWGVFPDCYVEGVGLTPFKKGAEYVISLIMACGLFGLFRRRQAMSDQVFRLMVLSIFLTICSEMAFTFYISVYGLSNLIGHFFKIVSFFLVYIALIGAGLTQPYGMMFRELKESEAKIRAFVDNTPVIIYMKDLDGRYILFNRMCEKVLNMKRELVIGKTSREILPQKLAEQFVANDRRVMETEALQVIDEVIEVDNALLTYRSTQFPVYDDEGRFLAICGISVDITEQRKAEEELRRSNEDLERFAYVASHDLQEPLRKVNSFSELLADRYRGQLDEKADKYLFYITDGAARMKRLIQDLLSFSRVATRGEEFTPADTGELLHRAIDSLQISIRESGARITLGELPAIRADAGQIVQLFQNLIGNAIKYRGDEPLRIHVTAEDGARGWIFSVRDNGIGVDEAYSDRIFEIFQRLHPRYRYPGTGIGLAICKRIVERHGGRIWGSSESGNGATFYFTITGDGGGMKLRVERNVREDHLPTALNRRFTSSPACGS